MDSQVSTTSLPVFEVSTTSKPVSEMVQQKLGSDGEESRTQPGSPKSRLSMLKRSSNKKANASSDPFRFQGAGMSYKGKLIGVRDVEGARGDQMCADAMREAKAAAKAVGGHKQRITLNINIEGIKIQDEKAQTVLHNFPVSRISFIARDTSDARAFGFVFGDSEGKYKFYGIKTAQTADHAVLAIRDMFQIVYEMKRKQIEQVKQKAEEEEKREMEDNGIREDGGVLVADLLDLETELHHIEQGVHQLSHIPVVAGDEWPGEGGAPADAFGQHPFNTRAPNSSSDPFGDSFVSFNTTNGDSWVSNPNGNSFMSSTPRVGVTAPPFVASQSPASLFGAEPAVHVSSSGLPADLWSSSQTPSLPIAPSLPSHAASAPVFSTTNPFAAAVPPPSGAAPVDPFDTSVARAALAQPPVQWSLAGNENTAPAPAWDGKKASSLEEAFSKLVDMDSLVGQPQMKKNPFDHLLNPPKVPLNSLGATPAAPAPSIPIKANDPFNDDFFN